MAEKSINLMLDDLSLCFIDLSVDDRHMRQGQQVPSNKQTSPGAHSNINCKDVASLLPFCLCPLYYRWTVSQ